MKETAEELFFAEVYTLLVLFAGADLCRKKDFVRDHLSTEEYPCDEWRFHGIFGMGGKYRSKTNTIDYYSEDQSEALDDQEKFINASLKGLLDIHIGLGLDIEALINSR